MSDGFKIRSVSGNPLLVLNFINAVRFKNSFQTSDQIYSSWTFIAFSKETTNIWRITNYFDCIDFSLQRNENVIKRADDLDDPDEGDDQDDQDYQEVQDDQTDQGLEIDERD